VPGHGVGERSLSDVHPGGAEGEQPLELRVLVAVGGVEVEVQPELARVGSATGPKTIVGTTPFGSWPGGPISTEPPSSEPTTS
jgi:hypothetical protein